MLKCKKCNKNFEVKYRYSISNTPQYCSKYCRHGISRKDTSMFKCKRCKKNFKVNYHISKNQKPNFCSNACAQSTQYPRKHMLVTAIKSLIKLRNKYTPLNIIIKKLSISSRRLSHHKISVIELNKNLGFKKPSSMMEFLVEELLISYNVNYKREHSFASLKYKYVLRFDFYLCDDNILLELDDSSHYDKNNPYFSDEVVKKDKLKNDFCKKNNLLLKRFEYYNVKKDSEALLKNIENILIELNYLIS